MILQSYRNTSGSLVTLKMLREYELRRFYPEEGSFIITDSGAVEWS